MEYGKYVEKCTEIGTALAIAALKGTDIAALNNGTSICVKCYRECHGRVSVLRPTKCTGIFNCIYCGTICAE